MTRSRSTSFVALLVASLGFLAVAAGTASAQTVEIKLGTLAPKGSTWENAMKEMAQKWAEVSGGKVKLRIYPGGVLGSEGAMVQKMRVGQINAASVTSVGLHDITPEPQAVSVPMGIASWDELDYVMGKMGPRMEKLIEDKGYVVIQWSDVGFVQFFSSKPIGAPAEFAAQAKLFAWEGDPASTEAMRAAGFHPVVLASTDVIPSLQTGMIDTIASAPLYALTSRLHQKANHMLDLRWGALNGATVVKKDAWEKIPADLRPKLLEISREFGRKIALDVRKMNEDAIATMKSQGLIEDKTSDPAGWAAIAEKANKVVRGKVVPTETFDEVIRLRSEYRAKHK